MCDTSAKSAPQTRISKRSAYSRGADDDTSTGPETRMVVWALPVVDVAKSRVPWCDMCCLLATCVRLPEGACTVDDLLCPCAPS